jgi:hypothetical protein
MSVSENSGSNSGSKVKKLLPIIVVLLVIGGVVNGLMNAGDNRGYAPEQPIPFSHRIHAADNNIPCMYCHSNVEKSKHATVPSMNVCMNCHSVVKPDSPYIQRLKMLVNEKKEPFEWIKVNNLPDFVNFNHKRHVLKGVACETCHGDVKHMAVVRQERTLNMGFCLDCHRGVTTPAFLLAQAKPEGDPSKGIPPHGVAPTNCYTCHH